MCLIICKEKGVSYGKISESIRNAEICNRDGMGYAIKRKKSNEVIINKGFFNVDDIIVALEAENVNKADELMVHLRLGTSGLNDKQNCHPFVVNSNQKKLLLEKGKVTKDPVITHNGIFTNFTYINSNFSDTYHFVHKFVSLKWLKDMLMEDPVLFEDTFNEIINYNKVAIMFPDRKMYIIKKDLFIEEGGVLYSNTGFKRYNDHISKHEKYSAMRLLNRKKTNQELEEEAVVDVGENLDEMLEDIIDSTTSSEKSKRQRKTERVDLEKGCIVNKDNFHSLLLYPIIENEFDISIHRLFDIIEYYPSGMKIQDRITLKKKFYSPKQIMENFTIIVCGEEEEVVEETT